MISFCCPNCHATLKVGSHADGVVYTCPRCKHRFQANQSLAAPPVKEQSIQALPPRAPAFDDCELPIERGEKRPRWAQRLGGCFMMALSAGMIVWMWEMVLTEGEFILGGAMGGPPFFVFGLAMVLFPVSWIQRHPEDGKGLTPLGWTMLGIGLSLGVVNYLLLKFGVP